MFFDKYDLRMVENVGNFSVMEIDSLEGVYDHGGNRNNIIEGRMLGKTGVFLM